MCRSSICEYNQVAGNFAKFRYPYHIWLGFISREISTTCLKLWWEDDNLYLFHSCIAHTPSFTILQFTFGGVLRKIDWERTRKGGISSTGMTSEVHLRTTFFPLMLNTSSFIHLEVLSPPVHMTRGGSSKTFSGMIKMFKMHNRSLGECFAGPNTACLSLLPFHEDAW